MEANVDPDNLFVPSADADVNTRYISNLYGVEAAMMDGVEPCNAAGTITPSY